MGRNHLDVDDSERKDKCMNLESLLSRTGVAPDIRYGPNEVCKILGISYRQLRWIVQKQHIPVIRYGKKMVFILHDDLNRMIESSYHSFGVNV